ncbi:unnamed protein product [Pedinophyceae sp. YPF-701]|nr:unnamed protein product [Pedinophyceae sp. YPF-701]
MGVRVEDVAEERVAAGVAPLLTLKRATDSAVEVAAPELASAREELMSAQGATMSCTLDRIHQLRQSLLDLGTEQDAVELCTWGTMPAFRVARDGTVEAHPGPPLDPVHARIAALHEVRRDMERAATGEAPAPPPTRAQRRARTAGTEGGLRGAMARMGELVRGGGVGRKHGVGPMLFEPGVAGREAARRTAAAGAGGRERGGSLRHKPGGGKAPTAVARGALGAARDRCDKGWYLRGVEALPGGLYVGYKALAVDRSAGGGVKLLSLDEAQVVVGLGEKRTLAAPKFPVALTPQDALELPVREDWLHCPPKPRLHGRRTAWMACVERYEGPLSTRRAASLPRVVVRVLAGGRHRRDPASGVVYFSQVRYVRLVDSGDVVGGDEYLPGAPRWEAAGGDWDAWELEEGGV